MEQKLSSGTYYSDAYFSTDVQESNIETVQADEPVEGWNDNNQFQLYYEALQWMGYNFYEIEGMCMKTEHLSLQSGAKRYGDEGL